MFLLKKRVQGLVISVNNKTLKVIIVKKKQHLRYKKYIKQKILFYVHDELKKYNNGEQVSIILTRSYSSLKHYIVEY